MKKVINFIFVICLILLGIFFLNRPHLSNGFYMGSSKQSEMMLNHHDHYVLTYRGKIPSDIQNGKYIVSGNNILLDHKLRGHINNKKSFDLFDGKYKETFNLIE
ncbi:hypothetical protein DY037_01445 [Apilactobacillus micheneri]|uniref:hypothetical protein n=1 Tax=Apilactobacillus micheneri TaxID=1899430 RepID=UPI00112D84CB|nr:hypothetical protein [Apilactobacillus micheneri]TPR39110.1 hypothetical protein DY119_05465 [Apilactobacillus micheneri]TPR50641.1 hypothetical protein DY037_01445 [Apilactobacillus micheneri]